jgi:hypothetical protein
MHASDSTNLALKCLKNKRVIASSISVSNVTDGGVKSYIQIYISWSFQWGHAVAWLVEALCHKPEGCEFDS